jgi:hypothetical protein
MGLDQVQTLHPRSVVWNLPAGCHASARSVCNFVMMPLSARFRGSRSLQVCMHFVFHNNRRLRASRARFARFCAACACRTMICARFASTLCRRRCSVGVVPMLFGYVCAVAFSDTFGASAAACCASVLLWVRPRSLPTYRLLLIGSLAADPHPMSFCFFFFSCSRRSRSWRRTPTTATPLPTSRTARFGSFLPTDLFSAFSVRAASSWFFWLYCHPASLSALSRPVASFSADVALAAH